MIQRLYTIRDTVAEENGPIFTAKNDGVALRQFKEILTSIQNDPEEYKLFCIGTWDSNDLGSLKSDMYTVLTYSMPDRTFPHQMEVKHG